MGSKSNKLDLAINKIVNSIAFKDRLVRLHGESLEQSLEEYVCEVNNMRKAIHGGINKFDVKARLMEKIDLLDYGSEKRSKRADFSDLYCLSKCEIDDLSDYLRSISISAYKVSVIIDLSKVEHRFDNAHMNDAIINYDDTKKLIIEVNSQGYFEFVNHSDFVKFSAIENAIKTIRSLLTYLSFFKNTIYIDTMPLYDGMQLKIENTEKITKLYDVVDKEIRIMSYPLCLDYKLRPFDVSALKNDFIKRIEEQAHLLFSIEWFFSSLCEDRINKKIIDIVIAYETLYRNTKSDGEHEKNKNSIAVKVAYSIARTSQARKIICDDILGLFKKRNDIVHGSSDSHDQYNLIQICNKNIVHYMSAFVKELSMSYMN